MHRLRILIGLLVVLVPLGAVGTLAYAGRDSSTLPKGTRIGGVAVGGLTAEQATARVQREIGRPAGRTIKVQVGLKQFRLSADGAGVSMDIPSAVQRAADSGRNDNLLLRGWDKLTGASKSVSEPVAITADSAKVRSFVGSIHAAVARKATDATYELTVTAVKTSPAQPGRRLAGREDLVKRISAALTKPDGVRRFSAHVAPVAPKVTAAELEDAHPLAVTVSKSDKLVRVFDHGKVVDSYHVAVGMDKYPTPEGQFSIQSVEKNPVWTVPNSDWAGDLAGKVIPGGSPENPLKAYFVRFDGSVGFHGTAELGSLGTAASHGCVRMNPSDVTALAKKVTVGTPVLVGA